MLSGGWIDVSEASESGLLEPGLAYRPWQPTPGEHLVVDWTTEGGWQIFYAVFPWSRWRFVRLATDQKAATTMALLAECFEEAVACRRGCWPTSRDACGAA